jgi:hypothetical protein
MALTLRPAHDLPFFYYFRGADGPRAAVAVVVQQEVCVASCACATEVLAAGCQDRPLLLCLLQPAVTGRVHPLERVAGVAALRGQPVNAFADASI